MIVVRKNARGEEIRVQRTEYNGYKLIQLRVWFPGDDGEMRPGKQGISFRANLLPEVIAALQRIEAGDE